MTGAFTVVGTSSLQKCLHGDADAADPTATVAIDAFSNSIARIIVQDANPSPHPLPPDAFSCVVRTVNSDTQETHSQVMRSVSGSGHTYSAPAAKQRFLKIVNGSGTYHVYIDVTTPLLPPTQRVTSWHICDFVVSNAPTTDLRIIHDTHDLYDNDGDIDRVYTITVPKPRPIIIAGTVALMALCMLGFLYCLYCYADGWSLGGLSAKLRALSFMAALVSVVALLTVYFFTLRLYHVVVIGSAMMCVLLFAMHVSFSDLVATRVLLHAVHPSLQFDTLKKFQ
uniref:Glutamyl-tRNA(Gln) amidotransferase subunit A n=1 Tax=Lygus hesperus TaxID=30085 RepID=A0A0A9WPU1_LYGHE